VQIQNGFEVPIPPDAAWPFLMDLGAIVPCFPGAELVEKVDEDNYRGRVTVKLGPLAMVFNGKLRIESRDEAARSGTVKASWTEAKGRGNATSVTRFSMHATHEGGGGTRVEIDSDIQLAGQVAQYGRGTGMIADISAQLIDKFAQNLRATIDSVALDPKNAEISGLSLASRALLNRLKRSGG
jgi:carbon monoxide dehydrogenase subunit G